MIKDLSTPSGTSQPLAYCGDCKHHDLEAGGLAEHGYGLCNARPVETRKAFYTCEINACRIGKFQPKESK